MVCHSTQCNILVQRRVYILLRVHSMIVAFLLLLLLLVGCRFCIGFRFPIFHFLLLLLFHYFHTDVLDFSDGRRGTRLLSGKSANTTTQVYRFSLSIYKNMVDVPTRGGALPLLFVFVHRYAARSQRHDHQ